MTAWATRNRTALVIAGGLLLAVGLLCVWWHQPFIPLPKTDILSAERVFLVNTALSLALVLTPSAFAFSAWRARRWPVRDALSPPMLWTWGIILLLILGAGSSALSPSNSDSIFQNLVRNASDLRSTLRVSAMLAGFVSFYIWFGPATGLRYNKALAKLMFAIEFPGLIATFFPIYLIRLRFPSALSLDWLSTWERTIRIGNIAAAVGTVLFAIIMLEALVRQRPTDKTRTALA